MHDHMVGKVVSAMCANENQSIDQQIGRIYAVVGADSGLTIYIRTFVNNKITKCSIRTGECVFLPEDDSGVTFEVKNWREEESRGRRNLNARKIKPIIRFWLKDDFLHREDGPAIECLNSIEVNRFDPGYGLIGRYYLNGTFIEDTEEFFRLTSDDGREKLIFKLDELAMASDTFDFPPSSMI